ncbi:MAG: hypothetical protein IPK19_40720 [Chloroflexi bacterium]|nr:hypothetical protein [Chloroflexota bacterium]
MPSRRPRHEDLLKLIAERRQAERLAPLIARQEALAGALDALNAYDALDDVRQVRFVRDTCFGPRPYTGIAPSPWVGVLIWKRAPGYFGYKTLTLYGVWARDAEPNPEAAADSPIAIAVGSKAIPYTSDFYDAEAYFKLIRAGFEDYYADDGRPPADLPAAFVYDRAGRLAQRKALIAMLSGILGGGTMTGE